MSETVEQCSGHFGIAEDARPFAECEIGGDDHRGALVEAADGVEQQLPAGLGEGQIAELVDLCRAQHNSIHVESAVMWSCPMKLVFDAVCHTSDST